MDAGQFDRIAELFAAHRLSRRAALRGGGAGLTAGLLGTVGRAAVAQEAAPGASPTADERISFMFVQAFEAGTLAPKAGAPGTYTLTLQHGLGQTLFFSDRPERIVGTVPTARFLAPRHNLGFTPTNPPNAALVAQRAGSATEQDVYVVELLNPRYDEAAKTVTYDVTILDDIARVGMTVVEAPQGALAAPQAFGPTGLFIDDCPDASVSCYDQNGNVVGSFGPMGHCYRWCCGCCAPCGNDDQDYWTGQCNSSFAACNNACTASDVDQPYYCWACPPACG